MASCGAGAGKGGPAKDYVRLVTDLRALKGVFLNLEAAIAEVPCGPSGATRSGRFLFDLLARVNLRSDTVFQMLALLTEATDLLSDNALDHGRKCAVSRSCPVPILEDYDGALRRVMQRHEADHPCTWRGRKPDDTLIMAESLSVQCVLLLQPVLCA